jgi:integrase
VALRLKAPDSSRPTSHPPRRNEPWAAKAGLSGLSPHELRHTCASLAIRSRASSKTVQRLLGHATAVMTLDQDWHLYPDELDQVAEQMGADCVYGR